MAAAARRGRRVRGAMGGPCPAASPSPAPRDAGRSPPAPAEPSTPRRPQRLRSPPPAPRPEPCALARALEADDLEAVKDALKENPWCLSSGRPGHKPPAVLAALRRGCRPGVLELLLRRGASANAEDELGHTPLGTVAGVAAPTCPWGLSPKSDRRTGPAPLSTQGLDDHLEGPLATPPAHGIPVGLADWGMDGLLAPPPTLRAAMEPQGEGMGRLLEVPVDQDPDAMASLLEWLSGSHTLDADAFPYDDWNLELSTPGSEQGPEEAHVAPLPPMGPWGLQPWRDLLVPGAWPGALAPSPTLALVMPGGLRCSGQQELGEERCLEYASLLLSYGADPLRRDAAGKTADQCAEAAGRPRLAHLIRHWAGDEAKAWRELQATHGHRPPCCRPCVLCLLPSMVAQHVEEMLAPGLHCDA